MAGRSWLREEEKAESAFLSNSKMKQKALGFPKSSRIRSSKEFEDSKKNGKRVSSANFLISYAKTKAPEKRIGFVVSSDIKSAVKRNKLSAQVLDNKRYLRAVEAQLFSLSKR